MIRTHSHVPISFLVNNFITFTRSRFLICDLRLGFNIVYAINISYFLIMPMILKLYLLSLTTSDSLALFPSGLHE